MTQPLLTQHFKIEGLDVNIYGSAWAVTDELIKKGGAAVEGMILTALTNAQDNSESYQNFRDAYIQHFGTTPGLGASNGYEAVMVLAEALTQTNGNKEGLREALLSISNFQGVHGTITFDENGDVYREAYLVQVKEKKFVTIVIINQEGLAQ